MFKNFTSLLAYLPLLPSLLRLGTDVQTDIANPSESNLNATVTDAEALVEKIFPQVPHDKVEAAAGIALVAITLESKHGVTDIEEDLIVVSQYLSTILGTTVTVSKS